MTLPKRARTLVVDGVEYRWLVSGKPHDELTLTVEPLDQPGAVMQVDHIDRAQLYRRDGGVDYDWRALIQRTGPDKVYPLDEELMHPRYRELGLTFECFCAGWDTDGWYYIGIRCTELPQVEAASMNNPAVP